MLAMSSGLTDTAEGVSASRFFCIVSADHADGVGTFGFGEAGVDGVDANLSRCQLLGQDAGDGVDCGLGGRVDGAAEAGV